MFSASLNPVIALVLRWRKAGWKHSEIDWPSIRAAYDYTQEEVPDPGPPYSVPEEIKNYDNNSV